jgi:hypothetical protein
LVKILTPASTGGLADWREILNSFEWLVAGYAWPLGSLLSR